VAICPRVHHLIGHNHKGRYDGRQEHGSQGVRRAEAVAQAFEVGIERAEQVVANFKRLSDSFSPTHTLAAMLLAAIVAAFVVVADQMMDTWADGHLFAAWVALWAVAFAAVGLFAGVSKTMAIQMKQGLDEWSARMAQSRSDERLWAIAQTDARLMSELQTAMSRSDEEELLGENSTQRRVARMLQNRQYYI